MATKSSNSWLAVFLVLILGSTLPSVEPAAAEKYTNREARTFLAALGERAIEVARDKTSTRKDQESQMRALLREGFDLKVLARLVLGKHWRNLEMGQREDFVELFEDAMVHQTLTMFSRYTGETFDITGAGADRTNPRLIKVSMDVKRSNGALLAKVHWRIRKDRENFRVVDIVVEGVSMALTLRQEYGAVIERSKGKIDGLIKALRRADACESIRDEAETRCKSDAP